jgi:hypothetical protein
MKRTFLDESGDHDLVKVDPQYPVCGLGGVICDRQSFVDMTSLLRRFKLETLGSTDVAAPG